MIKIFMKNRVKVVSKAHRIGIVFIKKVINYNNYAQLPITKK